MQLFLQLLITLGQKLQSQKSAAHRSIRAAYNAFRTVRGTNLRLGTTVDACATSALKGAEQFVLQRTILHGDDFFLLYLQSPA